MYYYLGSSKKVYEVKKMEIAALVISALSLIVDIIMLFYVSKLVNNVAQGKASKAASTLIRGKGNSSNIIQQ